MRLLVSPRRRPAINITSLIDVLFLLLTFFLVTTTFVEQSALKVELPTMQHSERDEQERRFVLDVAADGELNYRGAHVTGEILRKGLVEDTEAINLEGGLVLRADQALPHGEVIAILDLIRGAGIQRFVIATVDPDN